MLLATARSVMWWSRAIFSIACIIGGSFRQSAQNPQIAATLAGPADRLDQFLPIPAWPII
jgi:hypothetical protein